MRWALVIALCILVRAAGPGLAQIQPAPPTAEARVVLTADGPVLNYGGPEIELTVKLAPPFGTALCEYPFVPEGEPFDVATSPDGAAVAITDCRLEAGATGPPDYFVYSFDVEGEALTLLGELSEPLDFLVIDRWLSPGQFTLRGETGAGTFNTRYVYLADVAAESVERIAAQAVFRPLYFDDPPRYEWTSDDGAAHTVHVYTVATGTTADIYTAPCVVLEGFGCETLVAQTNASFTP